jgi:hypothetical protein
VPDHPRVGAQRRQHDRSVVGDDETGSAQRPVGPQRLEVCARQRRQRPADGWRRNAWIEAGGDGREHDIAFERVEPMAVDEPVECGRRLQRVARSILDIDDLRAVRL